ncbi:MAG: hypothetical protein ABSE73_32220 [Planctomycetota bacterium]|jgi:hypothetical protein
MNVEPSTILPHPRPITLSIRRERTGVVCGAKTEGKPRPSDAGTSVTSIREPDNDPQKRLRHSNQRGAGSIRGNFQQTTFKSKRQG